ncbi:MAG: hypothetical protein ABI947_17665 [Chloroflexota bacterium]
MTYPVAQNGEINSLNSGWAKLVSDVVSPPVVWALMAIPIAGRNAPSTYDGVTWALIYILLVSAAPLLYILIQVRRGNITDMHMPQREERLRPFIVSAIMAALATFILHAIGASAIMQLFVLSSLLQIVLMAIITTIWQISIHAISIAGAVITAGALYGMTVAFVLLPLVVIVGLARLKLRRHTRAQVVAGVAVGAISVTTLLTLAGVFVPGIWGHN